MRKKPWSKERTRSLPPSPCAARPGERTRQTDSQAREKPQRTSCTTYKQLLSARPETPTVDPTVVAVEDSRATREQTTPVLQVRLRMRRKDNRQARRVPRVAPESLPPASGSRKPAWQASGGAQANQRCIGNTYDVRVPSWERRYLRRYGIEFAEEIGRAHV